MTEIYSKGGVREHIWQDSDFVIIDLKNIDYRNIDSTAKTATIGGGVVLGELYYSIYSAPGGATMAFPGGTCPTVGASGLIQGVSLCSHMATSRGSPSNLP